MINEMSLWGLYEEITESIIIILAIYSGYCLAERAIDRRKKGNKNE